MVKTTLLQIHSVPLLHNGTFNVFTQLLELCLIDVLHEGLEDEVVEYSAVFDFVWGGLLAEFDVG